MAAAVNLIDDIDAARRPVEEDRTTMQRGRIKRGIAVMLGSPSGDVAVIDYLDLPGMRVTHPYGGATFAGLALAAEFGGVVRDRRPEI